MIIICDDLSWKILGMLKFWCRILLWMVKHANSHSKTLMQRFARHDVRQAYNDAWRSPWLLACLTVQSRISTCDDLAGMGPGSEVLVSRFSPLQWLQCFYSHMYCSQSHDDSVHHQNSQESLLLQSNTVITSVIDCSVQMCNRDTKTCSQCVKQGL